MIMKRVTSAIITTYHTFIKTKKITVITDHIKQLRHKHNHKLKILPHKLHHKLEIPPHKRNL